MLFTGPSQKQNIILVIIAYEIVKLLLRNHWLSLESGESAEISRGESASTSSIICPGFRFFKLLQELTGDSGQIQRVRGQILLRWKILRGRSFPWLFVSEARCRRDSP